MRKEDLASRVHMVHGGLNSREAAWVVDRLLDVFREALSREGVLKLSGFGTLKVLPRKGKTCSHPSTGRLVDVPPYRTVVFLPSGKKWGA